MARRDDLLAMLDVIEQNARTEQEAANVGRIRNAHLMYDAADTARPTDEDYDAVEMWVESYRASVKAQLAQLGNVLTAIGA
ncbi:hypothetical protein GR702_01400 [Novosphingobium sp. FGD1]|uniref:Uncharacterized protein n=1 Tax=Novosphingobium silvae TaxID=2692619 RepID=A0A7X4K5S6_9SPHN|nr:hypothetical protein [Novosphingobium silvae]MYL96430.1 hypothetical protein [Novosphingobium silvae]